MEDEKTKREWLEREARRVLSETQLEPNPELVAQGWVRRFAADPQRAREAMDLYSQLGYEVLAEPVRPAELDDDCNDCRVVVLFQFKTIYTRKRSS